MNIILIFLIPLCIIIFISIVYCIGYYLTGMIFNYINFKLLNDDPPMTINQLKMEEIKKKIIKHKDRYKW
jgi:uncharacterized protein YneF (UPF0154 family)